MREENKPLISIVVPCFNEEEVLPVYIEEMGKIIDKMQRAEVELIFVDDGSTDRTLSLLMEFHKRNEKWRYLSFSRNFGKEAAMYAGFQAARGDYVAVMDADLQDPPEYIPLMYQTLRKGEYDCVATRREDRKGEKKIRSFLSASFYKCINRISKVKIEEGARDFRMMTRKMTDAVLALSECNRFSKGLFGWVGFKTSGCLITMWREQPETQSGLFLSCLNIPWMGYWAFPLFLCQRRLTAAFCSAVLRFL